MFDRFLPCLTTLSASCALFACTAWAPPAMAGPTDDELGDLAEPLQTRVTTEFLDTPMDRVVEYFQRETGVTFVLDPREIAFLEDIPVSLKLNDQSVYDALELVALATDIDWVIRGQVVMVSSDTEIIRQRVLSGTYNLRGLMVHVPNFENSPNMDLDETLSNTNSGGSNGGGGGGGGGGGEGGGGALFGDESDVRNVGSPEDFLKFIVALVKDTTGEPELWRDEVFAIRSVQSTLIVRATPEVHAEVESLLTQLDRSLSTMLAVEAHYLVVPRSAIDNLDGDYILNKADCDAFLAELDNGNVRRLGSMRTVCHNGQRVYTFSGENTGFISDVEPIPDTASVDPTISVSRTGVSTDVIPTVTFDGQHIEVAVRSDMVHASEIATTPVPVVYNAEAGAVVENAAVGEVQVGLVTQQLTRFRTNVRVNNGGGVVLTASTNVFDGIDADQFEVILLVRTHILVEDEDE
ncbi:MAG: hypothetical protein ACIAXF_04580 [Phycisphaerales bacterium JB063]